MRGKRSPKRGDEAEQTKRISALEEENARLRAQIERLQKKVDVAEEQREKAVTLALDLSRALERRVAIMDSGK